MVCSSSQKLLLLLRRCERTRIYADIHVCMQVCHKDLLAIYQFWDIRASPVMNIDFYFFAFQANMRGHAHAPRYTHTDTHRHTNTYIQIPVPRCSQREFDYAVHFVCRHPLDRCICWANLDGFSVWILNQNHIFPPLPCCESPSCLPCLLPHPAIIHWQKRRWKKTLLWILIFTACWACVMNGSNAYLCIATPHIRWDATFCSSLLLSSSWHAFWQIVLQLHFLYLPVFLSTPSCFLFLKLPQFLSLLIHLSLPLLRSFSSLCLAQPHC